MNPKDPAFKKLQNKWYKKLKQTGFDDIESNENNLKVWSNTKFQTIGNQVFDSTKTFSSNYDEIKLFHESKEEYYRLASSYYWDAEFPTYKEKFIWEQHVKGLGRHEITSMYNKKYKTGVSDFVIRAVILHHDIEMKKKYNI